MIDFQFIILLLLAAALIALGLWVIRKYQYSASSRFFALTLLSLGLTAALYGILLTVHNPATLSIVTRFGYLAGAMVFSMLLQFSFYYPIPSRSLPRRSELLWIVPMAFFVPLFLFGDSAIKSVLPEHGGVKEFYGPTFWLFVCFVGASVVWTLTNLIQKLHFVQGRQQADTRIFIWALSVVTVFGFLSDVVLPATGRPRIPIGIYSSAVLFGLSTYIVTRK